MNLADIAPGHAGEINGQFLCDDCEDWYDAPVYYSLGGACALGDHPVHGFCTDNIGPCCADDIEPDNPHDFRRPLDEDEDDDEND